MKTSHCKPLVSKFYETSNSGRYEHFNRSADCAFFTLINNNKEFPAMKRTKSKKGRASKVSRLSTQNAFGVASEAASITDLPAEEDDSILTTATNATLTTQSGNKMGKGKKTAVVKGRKTKAKKDEAIEVEAAPEPEDDDFEVKVEITTKPSRSKKRKTDESIDFAASTTENQPPRKRRTTRSRTSTLVDEKSTSNHLNEVAQSAAVEDATKPKVRKKGRSSVARSTRKVSATSVASDAAPIPNDDEIDAALEADLQQRSTDNEEPLISPKMGITSNGIANARHAMFGAAPIEVDEAVIETELHTMEAESELLPRVKGNKGKQTRKVSAKKQSIARKAAKAEAEDIAQRLAEDKASQQVLAELEQSRSIDHSSPMVRPKRQRASSRQPAHQYPGRRTRASVMSINESTLDNPDEFHDAVDDHKDDSGDETDVSMASQAIVGRGGPSRRGSTTKKRGGKKTITRNIEEIVRKSQKITSKIIHEDTVISRVPTPTFIQMEQHIAQEEASHITPTEEPVLVVEGPLTKPRAALQNKGISSKAALGSLQDFQLQPEHEVEPEAEGKESSHPLPEKEKGEVVERRFQAMPPKDATPVGSSQSSDAENHPPSSKPSASAKKLGKSHATTTRIPLAATTPIMSPSKRNVIAGLQSANPWTPVDVDGIFLTSPGDEIGYGMSLFSKGILKAKNDHLTSPEKRMTVEEWIHYNAEVAEEKLRSECERMVGAFEREGGRAMRALEGVGCAT